MMRSFKFYVFTCGFFFFFFTGMLLGQITTTTETDGMSILDNGIISRNAEYKVGSALIQNGFSYSQMTEAMVSSGSDLVRAHISGTGFGMRQYTVSPFKRTLLDLDKLVFSGVDPSFFPNNDSIAWELGVTDFGDFQEEDMNDRGFYLDYKRLVGDIFFFKRQLYINPDESGMGINPGFNTEFNANLRVYGGTNVGIWSDQDFSNATTYGLFSRTNGTGTGIRYGVSAQALNSSIANYAIYGFASGSGTNYAVYAGGNMAYTGTLSNPSDRKLKRNIKDFDGLESLLKIKPRTYEYNTEEYEYMSLPKGKQFGFIAQELQEVLPEMVLENKHSHSVEADSGLASTITAYLGVRPLQLLPVLTRALQEEHEIVESQGVQIRHLHQENEALRSRMADLEAQVEKLSGQLGNQNNDPILLHDARLDQNFPNPYDQQTVIGFYVPVSVQRAELHIINPEGKRMQTIQITERGETKQVLESRSLQAGAYFYSLILDGQPIATRQMLLLR